MEPGTLTISSVFVVLQLLQCVFCFVNLSVNKTADMSSSQYSDKWLADEAIDGDISQKVTQGSCAVTSDNFHNQAWWRVDLGDVYVLNSVKIYYRKSDDPAISLTSWLSGFSIYVADTLNWWIGTRCYLHNNGEHTNPGPSDIPSVPCNATGRYVTVYKQRNITCVWSPHVSQKVFCAKLELCEVQVQSCEDGTYGESCSNNCSGNCLYGVQCNKAHGGCDDGCAPGYRGVYCHDECINGTYGLNCSYLCGHCNADTCNRINGTCPNGCVPGWKRIFCNETCRHGTFGQDCEESCSQHCIDRTCNLVNGTCDGGCQAGWMNHNCNKTCPFGRYGVNCDYNCSANCISALACRLDNGYCIGGCSEGWKGHHCDQQCDIGTYGRNCQAICFNCQNYTCNITNGACQSQCIDGYSGLFCNIQCTSGTYGSTCSDACGNCVGGTCNYFDGRCPAGCSPGWKGVYCNETCNFGSYGKQCLNICKSCTETCHHVTGQCLVFDEDKRATIIAITVIFGVAIIILSVALSIMCLQRRNQSPLNVADSTRSNIIRGGQGLVQLSDMNLNKNNTVDEMNPVTKASGKVTYEDLDMSTATDSNTYESLQPDREVTYTNTELF